MSQANKIDFVDIAAYESGIVIDMKYASSANFVGKKLYDLPICFLRKEVGEALIRVQKKLQSKRLGLKVWDGYRPLSVQKMMWDLIQDDRYVSNPAVSKGRHTRGTAVDVTLIDQAGRELRMPTPFDHFSETAASDYKYLSSDQILNRETLHSAMIEGGFRPLPTEWWHFDYQGWNNDKLYPPFDLSLSFLASNA